MNSWQLFSVICIPESSTIVQLSSLQLVIEIMTVYSSSLVFVSLTSLVYNIVLTIFRYSTWEIDDINGAVMDNFMFLSLFVASYVISGFDDIALQVLGHSIHILQLHLIDVCWFAGTTLSIGSADCRTSKTSLQEMCGWYKV